jgi:hypothetical protein
MLGTNPGWRRLSEDLDCGSTRMSSEATQHWRPQDQLNPAQLNRTIKLVPEENLKLDTIRNKEIGRTNQTYLNLDLACTSLVIHRFIR